jgi:cysteine synthase
LQHGLKIEGRTADVLEHFGGGSLLLMRFVQLAGIGLAMVCAQKGYPLVITMAETLSIERRKLMRFLGAKVVLTPAAQRGMGMVVKAAELAKTHGWFLTRQFENEANPDMHSRTREIIADFAGERLDYWVTG